MEPTEDEVEHNGFKGGPWFVRRSIFSGQAPQYFPTGIAGRIYNATFMVIVFAFMVFLYMHRDNNHHLLQELIAFGILFALFTMVAEKRTYRPVKGFWTQLRESRKAYKERINEEKVGH